MKPYRPILDIPITQKESILKKISFGVLVVHVVLFVILFMKLPDIIPIHWNAKGELDGHGSKNVLALMPLLALVLYFAINSVVHFPHKFNYPRELNKDNVESEYIRGRQVLWIVSLFTQVTFLLLTLFVAKAAFTESENIGTWFLIGIGGFTLWLMFYAFKRPE